jgi:hypothetical protein
MQRIALEAIAILEKEAISVKILSVPQFDDLYNDVAFNQVAPVRVSEDPIIIILHSSGTFMLRIRRMPLLIIFYRVYCSTKAHPDAQ